MEAGIMGLPAATTLKKADASNVKMIAGTSEEVPDELNGMYSRRIIAFSIEGENDPAACRGRPCGTIANFILFVGTILERRKNNALLAILDAIVPALLPALR